VQTYLVAFVDVQSASFQITPTESPLLQYSFFVFSQFNIPLLCLRRGSFSRIVGISIIIVIIDIIVVAVAAAATVVVITISVVVIIVIAIGTVVGIGIRGRLFTDTYI
jgi:hypothetical protein